MYWTVESSEKLQNPVWKQKSKEGQVAASMSPKSTPQKLSSGFCVSSPGDKSTVPTAVTPPEMLHRWHPGPSSMFMIPSSDPVRRAGWECLSWSFSASRVRASSIYKVGNFLKLGGRLMQGESDIDICVCMSAQTHTQIQVIKIYDLYYHLPIFFELSILYWV